MATSQNPIWIGHPWGQDIRVTGGKADDVFTVSMARKPFDAASSYSWEGPLGDDGLIRLRLTGEDTAKLRPGLVGWEVSARRGEAAGVVAEMPDLLAERPRSAARSGASVLVGGTEAGGNFGRYNMGGITLNLVAGIKGDTGAKGERGSQGERGLPGLVGERGAKGDTGEKGLKGDAGAVGLQGPKGDKGDTGPRGPEGPTGSVGPRGIPGEVTQEFFDLRDAVLEASRASAESAGIAAAAKLVWNNAGWAQSANYALNTGLAHQGTSYRALQEHAASPASEPGSGTDWRTFWAVLAAKGDKGDQGDQGLRGLKGDKGDQGIQGLRGLTGDQGIKGDTGDQGLKGDQGVKGDQGEQGIQGLPGVAGREYAVFVHRTDGGNVAAGGYIAERYVRAAGILDHFFAEITHGDGTAEVAALCNGAIVHGPITVAAGASVSASGLNIPLAKGDKLTFIAGPLANVSGLWMQLDGAAA